MKKLKTVENRKKLQIKKEIYNKERMIFEKELKLKGRKRKLKKNKKRKNIFN